MKKLTTLAVAKPRRRNSSTGTIGLGAWRSHAKKPRISAAPAIRVASASRLPQPTVLARTKRLLFALCSSARTASAGPLVLLSSALEATRHVIPVVVKLTRQHAAVVARHAGPNTPIVRLPAVGHAVAITTVGQGASDAARHRLPARLARW
jgi:hypothetical protein